MKHDEKGGGGINQYFHIYRHLALLDNKFQRVTKTIVLNHYIHINIISLQIYLTTIMTLENWSIV